MKPNMKLYGVPSDLQEKYSIGSELDVEVVADGFYLSFVNKKGEQCRAEPMEFYGRDIHRVAL